MLDLAGANAEGQCTERAVSGGVAVAAHHGHAGLSQPELRAYHVHNALLDAAEGVQRDLVFGTVVTEPGDLLSGCRIRYRLVQADRRNVVVHRGEREVGTPHFPLGKIESFEGLR